MNAFKYWRQGQSPLQAAVTAYSKAPVPFSISNAVRDGPFTIPQSFATFFTQANDPFAFLNTLVDRIGSQPGPPAYPKHVPLTGFQKAALAAFASFGAAADPRRADLVAIVGETTGLPALRAIRTRLHASPEGRALLAQRPRVTDETVAAAWDLPPHTFGGAYAAFMGSRGFHAHDRPAVRFVDDPELAWIAARAREVHDFWHVLFDCHTNVFGEVALKAVEFVQTGLPMTAMAVAAGTWRLKPDDRQILVKEYLPWAVSAGSRCVDLMSVHYEKHFEEDLEELRAKWRVQPAPVCRQNAPKAKATKPADDEKAG
jgi:ubiquinone biosynthesis protein COQ4